MLIELEPAFIIHTRAYRDTSLLVEAFTRSHGRVSLVARGVKGKKGSRANLLQPFTPLLLSWWAKGELGTLRAVESNRGQYCWLTGNRLISGLYINEITHRLLERHEAHPELFDYYTVTLERIGSLDTSIEKLASVLRLFEKSLITLLGYGLVFNQDALSGEPIQADLYYRFDPGIGCYVCPGDGESMQHSSSFYKGSSLLALHHEQFSVEEVQDAKRLMRAVLATHLAGKPVYSRSLWRQ